MGAKHKHPTSQAAPSYPIKSPKKGRAGHPEVPEAPWCGASGSVQLPSPIPKISEGDFHLGFIPFRLLAPEAKDSDRGGGLASPEAPRRPPFQPAGCSFARSTRRVPAPAAPVCRPRAPEAN